MSWVKVPGNPAANDWLTRAGCRTVLVLVPHMTAGTRLMDLLPLLETDHRLQVVFTVPATENAWPGTEEFVAACGGALVPWEQVVRSRYDLVLAASYSMIDRVDGPVLVVPHGTGGGRSRRSPWPARLRPRDVLVRDGRVVPAVVVVAHESDARRLREDCPEAADRIELAGDPCYDRMLASRPYRDQYRASLGVRSGQRLVMLSSTWSRHSLFGAGLEPWARVLTELPADRYRVVAALHPNIWAVHGRRQVLAWLDPLRSAGLHVVPPQEGWRAALVAADYLIGDHGSVTRYGAALGIPTVVTAAAAADVPPGGTAASLYQACPVLDAGLPVERQLTGAAERAGAGGLASRVTSCPGRSAAILRTIMYRLLGLSEPARALPVSPVPKPTPLPRRTNEWDRPW